MIIDAAMCFHGSPNSPQPIGYSGDQYSNNQLYLGSITPKQLWHGAAFGLHVFVTESFNAPMTAATIYLVGGNSDPAGGIICWQSIDTSKLTAGSHVFIECPPSASYRYYRMRFVPYQDNRPTQGKIISWLGPKDGSERLIW